MQVSAVFLWVFRELTSFDEIGAELEKKIVQLTSEAMGSWKLLSSIVLIETVTWMDPPSRSTGLYLYGQSGQDCKESGERNVFLHISVPSLIFERKRLL